MVELVIVIGDDWQGLYKNGVLFNEDHRISITAVLDALGGKEHSRSYIYLNDAQKDLLNDLGGLPEELDELVWVK